MVYIERTVLSFEVQNKINKFQIPCETYSSESIRHHSKLMAVRISGLKKIVLPAMSIIMMENTILSLAVAYLRPFSFKSGSKRINW